MLKILFFSRSELTDLYGSLNSVMSKKYDIIHVAYSIIEENILYEKYGVKCKYVFKKMVDERIRKGELSEELLKEIDDFIINTSDHRFCLNSAIQSDRGFSILEYSDSLLLAQIYYSIWKEIILSNKINFFIHEPTSLFFNHIASLLCKSIDANYCSQIMTIGEAKYNYLYIVNDNANCPELLKNYLMVSEADVYNNCERLDNFLGNFRNSFNVLLSDVIKTKVSYWFLLKKSITSYLVFIKNKRKLHILIDNIDYWLMKNNTAFIKFKNLIKYNLFLKYDSFDISLKYYYYSLHYEPEAVVLYWGDGLYNNQIKLIENIAAQLPPFTFLYVKDHPHEVGYRDLKDYCKLKNIPNVKLLSPEIPGKLVIKHSVGVFTINGTAGFEALLLNKKVFTFGNSYYNIFPRVQYIRNVRDIKIYVYEEKDIDYNDDIEFKRFVLAYLRATKQGVIDFFGGRLFMYDIDYNHNIINIADDMDKFLRGLINEVKAAY